MAPTSEAVKLRQLLSIRKKDQVTVAQFREDFERFARLFEISPAVRVTPDTIAGVPVEWVTAPEAASAPEGAAVLFLHGGGYVSGSLGTHRELVSRLSAAAGLPVVAADYRLAPEHPFPAGYDDAAALYRGLLAGRVDPARFALVGDSAGGGLGLATLMAARDEGLALPRVVGLIGPWVDLTLSGESMVELADRDPVLQPALLRRILPDFLAGTAAADPRVSPLFGALHSLPPMLIQVGTVEVLLDDSRRLAERAEGAGVEVTLEVWEGMIHDWHLFAHMVPEGRQAITRMGAFLTQHLEESASSSA